MTAQSYRLKFWRAMLIMFCCAACGLALLHISNAATAATAAEAETGALSGRAAIIADSAAAGAEAVKFGSGQLIAPDQAGAAGYSRLAYSDDFDNPATIDLSGSGQVGYQWYTDRPFSWPQTAASELSVANSILTIKQNAEFANYSIATVSPKTNNGQGFKYGYMEARLSFDATNSKTSEGWPSFWAMSRDHITGLQNTRWGELDIFEAWHPLGQDYDKNFVGTLHDWLSGTPNTDRGSYGNNTYGLPSVDFSQWHTYGALWRPGSVIWYFDGQPVITQQYSETAAPTPNPGSLPAGAFSVLDKEDAGEVLVLGSGVAYPLRVDWVRVWQK